MFLTKKKFYDLKKRVEKHLFLEIEAMGPKNTLRDACEFSLMNGGKRFRPLLVLLIAKALNKNFDVMQAALACEFFHTASLIADDLPSMDDEKTRRYKPALHLKYDEGTALLTSYSLISSGYELLYKNAMALQKKIPKEKSFEICSKAIEIVSLHAGIKGACGGQFLDLYCKNPSLDVINDIIYKKTISLFEISFGLGWIYGGGDFNKLSQVQAAAYHFGRAFQIVDDIVDFKEDFQKNKMINIAIAFGKENAKKLVENHLKKAKKIFFDLSLNSSEIKKMIVFLEGKI